MDKSDFVKYFLNKGVIVSQKLLDSIPNDCDFSELCKRMDRRIENENIFILDSDFVLSSEVESNSGVQVVESTGNFKNSLNNVNVIFSYDKEFRKKEVKDFVGYFRSRYNKLKNILSSRQELQESISIVRCSRKQPGDSVSIIGLVFNKSETKNGNIRMSIEDTTGIIDIIITKTNQELYSAARDVVYDEVVGVNGTMGNGIIFCRSIYFPDIPVTHEFKKSPDETYAVFISDIHFGIKNFLSGDFMKFVKWLRGEYGSERQREIAGKVGYLFVTGDVVEGVGIYPGQEDDLEIKDIYEQYKEAARHFRMIPERIKVIMCGGNHDAMRISEPQPMFDRKISDDFYELKNMTIVSNPAVVNIHSSRDFPGFNVLMYHGFSFPFFGSAVPSISEKGGIFRSDLIMKYLLQKRHLSPTHGSNLYIPDESDDPMVISVIPDIFVSGHIHQIATGNYRNVTIINSSCWVTQSEDQARRGIVPHPSKIPIINLKTREIKVMNFLDDNVKVLVSERRELK